MQFARLSAFLIVTAICPLYAADTPNASPSFLFSEDARVGQTTEQFTSSFEAKSLIREDKWLNAPLTRLDYVLLNIQARLTNYLSGVVQDSIKEDFEPTNSFGEMSLVVAPAVEFSARYVEDTGRLVLLARVDNLGKPRKPMKDFCETVLGYMRAFYPLRQNLVGQYWQDGALGLLIRGDPKKYSEAANTLSASALYLINMSASYLVDGKNTLFRFGCRQQSAGGPISFYKLSMSFPSTN